MITTEAPFTLPHGYLDSEGVLHRTGVMRMATAYDEIAPLKDPRVQANPGYLIIILLARVVTQLGELTTINVKVIENLFAADLAYLQDMYRRLNQQGHNRVTVACPHCEKEFDVELSSVGEA